MKEADITLHGKVQGVGLRNFAKDEAMKLELVGYVQNMKEGDVEICVQGEEGDIQSFLEKIKRGPFFAKVEDMDVEIHDAPQDSFLDFEIV